MKIIIKDEMVWSESEIFGNWSVPQIRSAYFSDYSTSIGDYGAVTADVILFDENGEEKEPFEISAKSDGKGGCIPPPRGWAKLPHKIEWQNT